jgi:shikimate kinase
MNAERACRVILIGMMGSGKSTLGRLLSAATGWPYLDNDELVVRGRGVTPRELLAEHGQEAMRAAESDALARGLDVPAPAIIGVAAGTILDAANRDRMRQGGIVVWLRADADTLEARARGAEHRPWLDRDGGRWMRDAVAEREPLYASIAEITLDTGSAPAPDVADDLVRQLREHPACR